MAWYLNLRGSSQQSFVQRYIDVAKQKRKAKEQNIINDWVNNDSEFDVELAIKSWEKTRKQYGDVFISEMLKAYALGNSLLDANTIRTTALKMEGEGIQTELFNQVIDKMFLLNVVNAIVENSSLLPHHKSDIISRFIAKQFPNKENKAPSPSLAFENLKNQVESFVSQPVEYIDTGE